MILGLSDFKQGLFPQVLLHKVMAIQSFKVGDHRLMEGLKKFLLQVEVSLSTHFEINSKQLVLHKNLILLLLLLLLSLVQSIRGHKKWASPG